MAEKQTAKAQGRRKPLPALGQTFPSQLRRKEFVKEFVKNGGNATRAYMKAYPNASPAAAATNASKLLRNANNREAILYAMQQAGVTSENISQRVYHLLSSEDSWSVNEGIKHGRKILGLDAPSHSHHTVDKRSLNITVSATDAKDALASLIKDSK